ncbi:RNA polymerase sigma factor [Candidatus Stoquefichus massiliensis]|uniref:RNA polymerase sigma factor n=1 Tax=Candidatus Stoquefichus massiliensis TaxID=1470350 RepID=UPI0004B74282|nr:sigma-70 family RNA polymerase sigma factor [Candidatus Stoquefichus massiliensis]
MNKFSEYNPLIVILKGKKEYFVLYKDINQSMIKLKVSKKVFFQVFGIHKIRIKNGKKYYFIEYNDKFNIYQMQLTVKEFRDFNSFKSQDIKYKNINDRYIEHSEQSDETIQKHMVQKVEGVEDIVYRNVIREEIQRALMSLNEIQRRRFVMHYIDEMTYEQIAKIEGCTKRAIKFSLDAARKNLQKMLKNLYLDYTNQ